MKLIKESPPIKIATTQICRDCGAVMRINEADLYTIKSYTNLWYKCPCCRSEHIPSKAYNDEEGFFTTYQEVHSAWIVSTDILVLVMGLVVFMLFALIVTLAILL